MREPIIKTEDLRFSYAAAPGEDASGDNADSADTGDTTTE